MARPIVTIPRSLLRLLSFEWSFDRRGTALGNNLAGVSVASYSQFPVWRGSLSLSHYGGQIGQWRALQSQVQGRHGIYAVEMIDPAVFHQSGLQSLGEAMSDGELFSDDTGFEIVPVCHVVGAHKSGARILRVDVSGNGLVPQMGQIMSANDRPFVVELIREINGAIYELQIGSPCLRGDVADGAEVRHVARGLFEAVDDTTGAASYGPGRHARPVLELREALRL